MQKLFQELKRRKVLTTLGVYGAAALVIINIATSVFPYLNLPPWTITFVIVLVILGFPITFFLSWTYDLKRGDEADDKSEDEDTKPDKKSKKILLPITGMLTIIGIAFWIWFTFGSLSSGSEMDNKMFKSIAVLYLENLSSDPNDINICAGLTTSITTAFFRLGRFKVKARTDVLKFKNKITSHKEIREILGVDAYIEGSLRKISGKNRYIANITLVDAEKGNNIWANEYNKTAEEISSISNTIASDVAQFLSGDEIDDFEVLNDSSDLGGHDKSFSLLGEGINLLDSGEYNKSIHVFDSILVNDPDNNRAIYSKGRALEELGQYSSAISYYNQILIDTNPVERTNNIFFNPDIIKHGVEHIEVYPGFDFVSRELNIQVVINYREDRKISEIYTLDLNTHKTIWKKTYAFRIGKIKVVGNNLVITTAASDSRVNEMAVYVHNLKKGSLVYSREFSKEHPKQTIIINILNNKGAEVAEFQDVVYLYVRRDESHSLVMFDPKSNQIMLEKVIPMMGVISGDPLIYLIKDSGNKYLFHKKGLNLYLFEIGSGKLIWNKTLIDYTYNIRVHNNVMFLYSNNETEIVLQNIATQENIGKFSLDSPVINGFFWKDNFIINTNKSIASFKTYKPFLRSLHNWTQYIDENDKIDWIFDVHDNLFIFTHSGDLYCINGNSGDIINKNSIGHDVVSWHYELGHIPDFSSSKSFIIYADGFLIGLDPHNGKTLWKIRELNIETSWPWVYGHIIPVGNKVIVLKKPDINNNIIMKAYNRMTGELLWQTEENILQGLTRRKSSEGWTYKIHDAVYGYVLNNTFYIYSSPAGFIYNADISWKPNKNYISNASIYNSLARCYNKINNQEKAKEMLNNIVNVVDQQNELAFQQLSDLYLSNNDNENYIKSQLGFHELVYYDDIKRGNIENELMQTTGLKWVQHFKRKHDFAVNFPDKNIAVSGLCKSEGGCTLKYYRTSSGIIIGENKLDLHRCTSVVALDNKLVFVGEKRVEDGSPIYTLFVIDPQSQTIKNKISLWDDGYYTTEKIYYFDDMYIVDSYYNEAAQLLGNSSRYLTAVDGNNEVVMWKNNYEYDLLHRTYHAELINKNNFIIVPLSEQLQIINKFSGEIDQVYEFDEFDGIRFIDQNSLNGDNISFITIDDEFVTFNLTSLEILHSDEIYFDNILKTAFLNYNSMLSYTYDGFDSSVILYEYNGKELIRRWIEHFKGQIRILDVIDNTAYILSSDGGSIITINFENPINKKTNHLLWDAEKIFVDIKSYGILYKNGLYFITI